MNIRKFWLLITVVCLSMILIFSVVGCGGKVASKGAAKEEAPGEEKPETEETLKLLEKPDKELFDKNFSDIGLGGARGFFAVSVEKNVSTFLPHQSAYLYGGFKNEKNFIFKTAVLNLETNDFIKRCAATASSEGSDGFSMEALEWAFLRPGSYEYRIYIEDTLVAILPFEVISYVDYFEAKIDKVKLWGTHFFENLREER